MEDRNITILYASETGTTEDYAQELGRTLERLHFTVRIIEMDLFDPKHLLSIPLAIFMCPTTGQGDMPENMQKFWRFLLRKKLPANLLRNVKFTSFGLGDSTYPKFNWAVRKLHKRLLQLGAQDFYIRGEGDAQHEEGTDGALIPWVESLSSKLLELFPLPADIQPLPSHHLLPPKLTISVDDTKDAYPFTSYASNISLNRGPSSFVVTVDKNDRLTPETHFQDVRLFNFSSSQPLSHAPGDALSILPTNPETVVLEAIEVLNLEINPDQPLLIHQNSPHPILHNFIQPLTLRTLLTHHLDVTAIPRRSFFTFCAAFTDDETHRERLIEFTDPKYAEELWDYTTRPRRSILEVLQEFGSVKIPLAYVVEMIPRIKARLFSIASSKEGYTPSLTSPPPLLESSSQAPENNHHTSEERNVAEQESAVKSATAKTNKYKLDLLIAIVKYRTVIKRIRRGMCTHYLSHLQPGDTLNVTLTRGGLGSSASKISPHTPIIMVGPGTGVAPMRAMIHERIHNIQHHPSPESGLKPGKMLLFFGCRGRELDYYFGDEWSSLEERFGRGVFEVRTAFSREGKEKRYVQNLIKEGKEEVWRLVADLRGAVYVCGSSGRMPQAVREALIEVFEEVGGMKRDEAEAYLLGMEGEGRYRQETW
ncbi:NAPDH-dependent diflavin reductase [Orbilia ellipsospora]|uniref:NADPH-dependent diflavin oxidoreductase 1 n=1 Tax=Orbilia ellipsospora TaxID=2528407 RepID=A0AAV9X2N1_9PEZI